MKIKKKKLEGNINFFYWRVKLKRQITLTKGENLKNEDQIEKQNTP